jgi:putative spermidine/putrescine transport system substrate-binding protein
MPANHPLDRTLPSSLRRTLLRRIALAAGGALLPVMLMQDCLAQPLARPKGPVALNVVDVAGDLALTQAAFELYAKKNPGVVSRFTFTKATAPEMPGKLKAMQDAGRSDVDIVLTGVGFLGNAVEQGLLTRLLPEHAGAFPGLMDNYQPAAAKMQDLAQGQGIEGVFMPAGPLLEYNPA